MQRKTLFCLIVLSSLFFLSRFYNILSLPIFIDEAIYIQWAQVAKSNSSLRFISLVDGKQPLFIWFVASLVGIFKDPLLAGRTISVIAGFLSMIGLFFLTKELFKSYLIGFFSAFIYLIYPFALVLDRLALYDSLVGAFAVWSMYFSVLLVRLLRLDLALILGMILGGGILTKTSSFFSIYLLPLTLFFINFKNRKLFLRWAGLFSFSVILAYAHYNILRLSPNFYQISQKNGFFINDLSGFLLNKFYFNFFQNITSLSSWIITYFTFSMIFLIIISFFISKKYLKEKIFLFLWFIIPFLLLALFGRIFFPRFVFFMTLYLIPLISFSLAEILRRFRIKIFIPLFIVIIFQMITADYYVLSDFKKAPIPKIDLNQFVNDWPSGRGIKETIAYLENISKKEKIYVVSEGIYGSLPTTSLEIYLKNNKNIQRTAIEPIPEEMSKELKDKVCKYRSFLLLNQMQFPPSAWPAEIVFKYKKGEGNSYLSLYKIRCSL